jgi:hypothetical protein
MKSIPLANLHILAADQPHSYLRSLIEVATIEGDVVMISEEDFARLHPVTSPPSLTQQATSFAGSMATWAVGGFHVADEATLASRMAICKGCEFWDASGFGGTGRCQKCGCSTQAKLRMATASCPLNPPKWGPATQTPVS